MCAAACAALVVRCLAGWLVLAPSAAYGAVLSMLRRLFPLGPPVGRAVSAFVSPLRSGGALPLPCGALGVLRAARRVIRLTLAGRLAGVEIPRVYRLSSSLSAGCQLGRPPSCSSLAFFFAPWRWYSLAGPVFLPILALPSPISFRWVLCLWNPSAPLAFGPGGALYYGLRIA